MIARWLLHISTLSLLLCVILISASLLIGRGRHSRELAFVREESVDFSFNLYLMDVDYDLTMRLTRRALWYDDFAWSPDGEHIAVELVTRDSEDLIFLIDMQGNDSLLTQGHQPAWSPDGTRVAYVTRGESGYQITTFDLDTQVPSVIGGSFLADATPTWSPDGMWVAYLTGMNIRQIFLIDALGNQRPRRITDGAETLWSSNSRAIVCTSYRDGDYDVYSVNLDTGQEHSLTDTLEDERYPVWSPDGTRLAYVATYGYADFLRILSADGTISNIDLSLMIGRRVYVGEPPVWSADGRQLVLSLITPSVPNAYSLYILTFDNEGVNVRRLTDGWYSELHPAWRPTP